MGINKVCVLSILLSTATLMSFSSCDDDGLTEGDKEYFTSSRGQFTVQTDDGSTWFMLDNGDGTAAVTYDGSNPLHWTSSTVATVNVTTYSGSVNIPETVAGASGNYTVTSIGDEAFMGCRSLTACNIPSTVQTIGEGAFCTCTSLTSINVPEGVTDIPSACFGYCPKLVEVYLPSTVASIGRLAFGNCTSLSAFHIKAVTPPSISGTLFDSSVAPTVYVPIGSIDAYRNAEVWSSCNLIEE